MFIAPDPQIYSYSVTLLHESYDVCVEVLVLRCYIRDSVACCSGKV